MSEVPSWIVGNRNPSITENIVEDAGAPVNLTGATVKFQARLVGATALIVDQTATIVNAPGADGLVRYDWSAADIAANGILADAHEALVWWRVTSGGKTQDMMEALISVIDHLGLASSYVELEQFKHTLSLTGTTFTDLDARRCLVAASRGVDQLAGQRFYLDPDDTSVRYFTPLEGYDYLAIDGLVDLNSVTVDRDGNGSFEETWVAGVDFVLEPVNAPLDGKPYTQLRILRQSTTLSGEFPCAYPQNSVKVTGQFGWPAVPESIQTLTMLIAARLFKAVREAPWGVIGFDQEGAVRISKQIPDVELLLGGVLRRKLLV